ncbi:MAG TPA: hypothetical protein VME47_07230 [Acetobacteraceae bacterium]|nr:hypothetical protein [Acetobacteraceae bacterium]
MIKQALVVSVFAAGTLVAGAALAQPVPPGPPPQVGHGGYVGNNGCVEYSCDHARNIPAAPISPLAEIAPPATYNNAGNYGDNWQSSTVGLETPNPTRSEIYTFALNDLYAHGFHGAHHLWMSNGGVHATAVTPNGARRQVIVQPESGQISLG